MDFEEIQFDDVIAEAEAEKRKKKKKKVDSKAKGNRTENNLCKLLKDRFKFEFTRTLGSGNRHGQVFFLPTHAQQTFSGDLVCPENFNFVIECKGGYNDIDLVSVFSDGSAEIDKWIKQCEEESERCGREPLICWKKDYKNWLAFFKDGNLKKSLDPDYKMHYREWEIVLLSEVIDLDDSFFFRDK